MINLHDREFFERGLVEGIAVSFKLFTWSITVLKLEYTAIPRGFIVLIVVSLVVHVLQNIVVPMWGTWFGLWVMSRCDREVTSITAHQVYVYL